MVEIEVGPMEAGKKVHRWMRQLLPGIPLSGIHKMIRTGRVKRNGKRVKPDDVLTEGDVIRLYMAEEDFSQVSKPVRKYQGVPTDIEIVYEDDDLIAVNKPAGLLTHGAPGEHKDTLANRVAAHLYARGDLDARRFVPAPAHRLDRNTSGLVLFAKHGEAARKIAADLQEHRIRKWYVAIVRGLVPAEGQVEARLEREERRNRTFVLEQSPDQGKDAITRFRRLAQAHQTSVVCVELVTGRTHQIRAHFAHLGYPLWGDVKYGGARPVAGRPAVSTRHANREPHRDPNLEPHQWLHAGWLQLADGRLLHAPLPESFRRMLHRLGYSSREVMDLDRAVPWPT